MDGRPPRCRDEPTFPRARASAPSGNGGGLIIATVPAGGGESPPLSRDVWAELVAGGTVTEVRPRAPLFQSSSHTLVAAVLRGLVRVFLWIGPQRQVTIEYVSAGHMAGLARVLSGRDEIGAEAVTASTVAMLSME